MEVHLTDVMVFALITSIQLSNGTKRTGILRKKNSSAKDILLF